MFYKKKTDSRVRFQNSRFQSRLRNARGYKRAKRAIPEGGREAFFYSIGLGSWLARLLTLAGLLFLIYLVYIPNIFYIKQVKIAGAEPQALAGIEAAANGFLKQKLPFPQKNLLLLSKDRLKQYILKNNNRVIAVTGIRRKYPNTLEIDIVERLDTFVLKTAEHDYMIANDGLTTKKFESSASSTGNLAIIKLDERTDLVLGQQAFTQGRASYISELEKGLPGAVGSRVDYFELDSLQALSFDAYFSTGLKIMFDFNLTVQESLNSLRALVSQLGEAELKRLFYVDMRFKNKGYVCYKGARCVNDANLSSSSTPARN